MLVKNDDHPAPTSEVVGGLDNTLTGRQMGVGAHLGALGEHFLVADAKRGGLSYKVLRGADLHKPFFGVRSLKAPETLLERAAAFSPRLREGEAFSHTTVLRLLGAPINCAPDLHVTSTNSKRANRTNGVVGHEASSAKPFGIIAGMAIFQVAQALAQSSQMLSVTELVVAIDHLLNLASKQGKEALRNFNDELQEVLESKKFKGKQKFLKASRLASIGAESRMETLTRLLLVRYGLADYFELQLELFDGKGLIGRFDFLSKKHRVIIEYDGEQHRTDRAQYLKDISRLERAQAAGYTVIRCHAKDILHDYVQFISKVKKALGVTG